LLRTEDAVIRKTLMLCLRESLQVLFTGSVMLSILTVAAYSQSSNGSATPEISGAPPLHPSSSHKITSPYVPKSITKHARDFYRVAWGVDSFSVRSVESGEMIRFSYRVVNVEKAKVLNDKKNAPYLVDEKAHVKLIVPTMEKVGQLRQSSAPEAGKVYWMVFSNKGHIVKPGSHVSVIIGRFHADGLVVEGS
jgi:hypothetical protein